MRYSRISVGCPPLDECPGNGSRLRDRKADYSIPCSKTRARSHGRQTAGLATLGKKTSGAVAQPPPERVVPPPAEPPTVTGVRITKKFEHRFRVHETGDFPCTLCNRLFTTGTALATHVRSQHREGTFREHGFACPCCPRVFVTYVAHPE